MGFGLELGKTIAKTGANMLTGGLVNGIMGLFGGSNGAEQRQYQHEKEMMALQNKYNTQAAAQSMEYAKTMNRINFEQQNQMFDKQAEWNSAKSQKERLQEAGLNPALMYGIGGEGGSSVSSGGGTGPEVQGVGNAGTQAVMMGLQAKSIESQIALNNAQASKINAETEKTEADTVIAQENGIQGRVICQFVVNRDGSIVDVEVVRSVDPSLDKEAIRVIKSMPAWSPGKQRGKSVRVKYTLPVNFRLQN